MKYESRPCVVGLLKITFSFSKSFSTEAIKSHLHLRPLTLRCGGKLRQCLGAYFCLFIVSIAEVITGLNMSMVLLDKFPESLLGISLLLLY